MTVVLGCQKEVKPTGTVVLYTSVPTDIIDEVKAEFEKRQPGVKLDIFRSGTGMRMDKTYEEIEAGRIKADVIRVADFTVGEELKNAGHLLKYESPQATEIMPSQNVAGAKAFVDFILSKEGQELMSTQGVAPVRLDVTPPLGTPTITQMKIIPSNPAEILKLKEDTKRIFAELFQDKQVESTRDRTITLYTSVPTAIIEELRQDFEAQNPGLYLQIFRKGTSAVVEK